MISGRLSCVGLHCFDDAITAIDAKNRIRGYMANDNNQKNQSNNNNNGQQAADNGFQLQPQTRLSESGAPTTGRAVHDFFSTDEIFQRVAATADEEFERPLRLMAYSGLAAGFSIGLSFYARAAITAQVPENPLIGNLVYPIGFLLIVIGRYQLFTENTLTPVTLVLTRIASLPMLLRTWLVVLLANLVGATILALVLAETPILLPAHAEVAISFWNHAIDASWEALFVKGVMAGWLVASMVWLIHAARDTMTRVFLVIFMMFLIPSSDLYHCIIGFCEAMYAFFVGVTSLHNAVFNFFVPVLLGNTLGGVLLVAILNYSMTKDNRFPDRDCGQVELSWREWLFEFHAGAGNPETSSVGHETPLRAPVNEQDHILGPDDSPVTLVQYSDLQCGLSEEIYSAICQISEYTDIDYRYVYRHLPLSRRHKHALRAAIATEAAAQQGQFWQMVDALFRNQRQLDDDHILVYARELGLNMQDFEAALEADALRGRVERHRTNALNNSVTSADNLFINGERYHGPWTPQAIAQAIQRAIPRQRGTLLAAMKRQNQS